MNHLLAALLSVTALGLSSPIAAADRTAPTDPVAAPSSPHDTIVLAAHAKTVHPAYRQTVVLVTSIDVDQHVGVIVNRPTTASLSSIFPDDPPSRAVKAPVYFGGPMGMDMMLVLTMGAESPGGKSVPLGPSLHLAFEQNVINRIIQTTPNAARYFVGMVQWRPGELVEEVRQGYWHVIHTEPERVLQKGSEQMWKELTGEAGRLVAQASRLAQ